jgi:hypothetical protein
MTNDIKHSPHLTQDEIELLVKAGVDTTDERFSSPAFKGHIIKARNVLNVPEEFYASLFGWIFNDACKVSPSQREDLMYELVNHCFCRIESEGYQKDVGSLVDEFFDSLKERKV